MYICMYGDDISKNVSYCLFVKMVLVFLTCINDSTVTFVDKLIHL